MNIVIKDARVCDPSNGTDSVESLFIEDGILQTAPSCPDSNYEVIDGPGLIVTPGFVDLHVHFREPGGEDSETMITGARAAARGGFTDVVTMPNTSPPIDDCTRLRALLKSAENTDVNVHPSACATTGRSGTTLSDIRALLKAGAACFTDDGSAVSNCSLMTAILSLSAELGVPFMQHAVDPVIAGPGVIRDCCLARQKGLPVFNPEAEVSIVKRDISIAGATGGHLHVQHISTSGALAAIRNAIEKRVHVTCEATPHHLALSTDDITKDDPDFKMNPPLGSPADRENLLNAVANGTVSCLATDHAPHSTAKKQGGFAKAAFGITGLETAAAVTFDLLVRNGVISLNNWVRLWTTAPAAIIKIPVPPLQTGAPANIAVFRTGLNKISSKADFLSKSHNTPFVNRPQTLDVVMTLCRGRRTWFSQQLAHS